MLPICLLSYLCFLYIYLGVCGVCGMFGCPCKDQRAVLMDRNTPINLTSNQCTSSNHQ